MERALCFKRPGIKSQVCYSLTGWDLDIPLTSLNLKCLILNMGLIIISLIPGCCKNGTKSVVMKNALPPMLASQNSWCNNHVPSFGFRAEEGLMNRITASAFEISWSTCGKESHKQILKYKMRAGTTEMCSRSGDCKNKWMPKSRGWENKVAVVTKAFLEEVMPEMAFKKRRNFF